MDTIFALTGYTTSHDYEQLADAMQHRSIICIVDYQKDCRDVAQTIWSSSRDGKGVWQLSARGYGYVYARSRGEFIIQCAQLNVEVLMPTLPPPARDDKATASHEAMKP